MAADPLAAGTVLEVAATAGFFGWLFWAKWRQRHRRSSAAPIADEPEGTPYRVFTRRFDEVVAGRDVPARLAANIFLRTRDWGRFDRALWLRKVAEARSIADAIPAEAGERLRCALTGADDVAIALLVDQSGSMKDEPIAHAATTARWASRLITASGAACAVLGFTTVGWQGGEARQQWLGAGRPSRPGRLCALLHIVYPKFGESLADEDWAAMLYRGALFENVDGEAIAWSSALLRDRPARRKLLIVLSDGAPVDDSTLTDNGPSYLERHVRQVIAAIEGSDDIRIGAIGIGFAMDRYYACSRQAANLDQLPVALADLIGEMLGSDH